MPRAPIHLRRGPRGVRLVTEDRRDLTDDMAALARRRTDDLAAISGYVFKSKSPSCGIEAGGLFAAAVIAHFPGLPVIEERALTSDAAVDDFAARARAYAAARGRT